MRDKATVFEQLQEVLRVSTEGMHVDWGSVAAAYGGINFPLDYQKFLSVYGSGEVDGMLAIFAPTLESESGDRRVDRLPEEVRDLPEVNEWANSEHASQYTADDILVWGETVEADVLGWITVGPPEEWPVAVYSHGGSWTVHECAMTEFLLRIIIGDFDENPTSLPRLFGAGSSHFGHE